MEDSEQNKYNYLTPEHIHNDGTVGRDLYATNQPATLVNKETDLSGLPKAQDIGTKTHLVKGEDY